MNTSIKTHAVALVGAALVTWDVVDLIANYAYPAAPAPLVASAARLGVLASRAASIVIGVSMNTSHFSLSRASQCAALVLSVLTGEAVLAQTVELDANCAPQLTRQQQRLYQKANDGTDALRQFIFIRRAILQVDTYETATWAESLNEARAACAGTRSAAASAQATPP